MSGKRPAEPGVGGPEPKRLRGPDGALQDNGEANGHPAPTAPGVQREVPKGLELPSGWARCPSMGRAMHDIRVVPIKVPLSLRFKPVLRPGELFTPSNVLERLQEMGIQVGLVIDLTKTWRYYDPNEWIEQGVEHCKVPCQGRGQPPEPEAVNRFCWTLYDYLKSVSAKYVVVHCTHGYNRTGYMVANFLVRFRAATVAGAVKTFRDYRPPGIYKEDYIRDAYCRNNERIASATTFPATPDWKLEDPGSPDLQEEEGDGPGAESG